MSNKRASQTAELADLIVRQRPDCDSEVARSIALSLVRAAKALSHIAELQCSVEMSERTAALVELREKHLQSQVHHNCAAIGVTATFSGDPRGYVVKLHFGPDAKRQPGNTWGGTEVGWGIG